MLICRDIGKIGNFGYTQYNFGNSFFLFGAHFHVTIYKMRFVAIDSR